MTTPTMATASTVSTAGVTAHAVSTAGMTGSAVTARSVRGLGSCVSALVAFRDHIVMVPHMQARGVAGRRRGSPLRREPS